MADYNLEALKSIGTLLAKYFKSSKIIDEIEENYPFNETSFKKFKDILEKEFKNLMIKGEEKHYEKEIFDGFITLLKNLITDEKADEVFYKISKEFNDLYKKGKIENFIKNLKKYQKELKSTISTKNGDGKDEIINLLNKEEELKKQKRELIETIEIFIKNLTHFFETEETLKQKIKNLKEEISQLETLENIKQFKSEVKDLFLKLGIIERVLEEEKKELKNIILLMAESLKEFLGSSDEFSKTIEEFVNKIQQTDDVDEIKKIKLELLKATENIKNKTENIHKKLTEADRMIKQAQEKMKKLEEEMEKAKKQALYDGLTGAYTRAVFNDRIVKEIEKAKREGKKLCFMMIDIDHFKKINDTYGHQTGDLVLKILIKQIKKVIRDFDFLARYGGEEFCIILPDTDIKTANEIAERIRKKIEKTKFIYKGEKFPVTISIGVTELNKNDNEKTIIERADRALYKAKNSGRNRVIVE